MCQPKLLVLGPGEDCLGRRAARGWPLEKQLPFPADSNPTSIPGPAISLSRRHVFPGKPFHGPLWLHVAFLVFHTHRIRLLLEKKIRGKMSCKNLMFPFDTAQEVAKSILFFALCFPQLVFRNKRTTLIPFLSPLLSLHWFFFLLSLKTRF